MLKIGLTGGIGTGKTTVSNLFATLKVPVYNADNRAKEIMVLDEDVRKKIISTFGNESYNTDGLLNRNYLSEIVFKNPEKLTALNAIVHPAVGKDRDLFLKQHANAPYIIAEAALLVETGTYKIFDKIILVVSPLDLRIKRVCKRDQATEEEVQRRINNQLPDDDKIAVADFVIHNNEHHSLIEQVMHLHNFFTKK